MLSNVAAMISGLYNFELLSYDFKYFNELLEEDIILE
jgi:hypothetical protein